MIEMLLNPFQIIIDVVSKRWPETSCEIYFAIDDGEDECQRNYTHWDNDGNVAIVINPHEKYIDCVEFLAHELAHVVAGHDADHGPEWGRIFYIIYEDYHDVVQEIVGNSKLVGNNKTKGEM